MKLSSQCNQFTKTPHYGKLFNFTGKFFSHQVIPGQSLISDRIYVKDELLGDKIIFNIRMF